MSFAERTGLLMEGELVGCRSPRNRALTLLAWYGHPSFMPSSIFSTWRGLFSGVSLLMQFPIVDTRSGRWARPRRSFGEAETLAGGMFS